MPWLRPSFRIPWALLAALLPMACAAGDAPPIADAPSAAPALDWCSSPRPEYCTREYRPACGHRCAEPPCAEGQRSRYGNACTACTDPDVRAVSPGDCDAGDAGAPVILR